MDRRVVGAVVVLLLVGGLAFGQPVFTEEFAYETFKAWMLISLLFSGPVQVGSPEQQQVVMMMYETINVERLQTMLLAIGVQPQALFERWLAEWEEFKEEEEDDGGQ